MCVSDNDAMEAGALQAMGGGCIIQRLTSILLDAISCSFLRIIVI